MKLSKNYSRSFYYATFKHREGMVFVFWVQEIVCFLCSISETDILFDSCLIIIMVMIIIIY